MPSEIWDKHFNTLPKTLKESNARYTRWQDRHLHLFGKLLLAKALEYHQIDIENLNRLKYNKFGKPYFDFNLGFNISHSGSYVLCAFSDFLTPGIDIEEIKPIDISLLKHIFSDGEWKTINSSDDSLKRFYDLWTMKEAVIKADGRGLSIPLKKVNSDNDGVVTHSSRNWRIYNIKFDPRYSVSIAVDQLISHGEILLEEIDFYNFSDKSF
ncbi:4'-phosphopantetheinyl transferase family protein [Pedobacter kyonggii]|nr:4'-phosphopantetheinyl transferase superfamily protein [Pedobacter kyonggii]